MTKRLLYPDILRIVAIIAIIALHVSGGYLHFHPPEGKDTWWETALIYDIICKWGTAVFLMISGIFMLSEQRSTNLKYFFSHRFKRILIPFVAWAIIYKLSIDFEGEIFSFKTLFFLFKSIITGNVKFHLWFVYMIFCLYLITPILTIFINSASHNKIKYYFIFWFIATVFPPIMKEYLGLENGFSAYFQLHQYAGFYLLGYYLHKNPIKINYLVYLIIPLNFFIKLLFNTVV